MLTLRRSDKSKGADLEAARGEAIESVNSTADAVRRLYITPIAGQEMIYLNKEQEAKRFLSLDPMPRDAEGYPFIYNEIGATAETAREVAQIFKARAHAWRGLGAMLERLRVNALHDVKLALGEAEISKIMANYAEDMEELS